jgi:hypothetical protein
VKQAMSIDPTIKTAMIDMYFGLFADRINTTSFDWLDDFHNPLNTSSFKLILPQTPGIIQKIQQLIVRCGDNFSKLPSLKFISNKINETKH